MEPVVTQCGHLYCWPCLYRWLEPGMLPGERQSLHSGAGSSMSPYAAQVPGVDETRRVCPVCKAPCCVPSLVPIYVRCNNDAGEEKEGIQFSSSSASLDDNDGFDDVDDIVEEVPVVGEQQREWEENEPEHEGDMGDASEHPMDTTTDPSIGNGDRHDDPTATTGLRQRLRFRSNDSEISAAAADIPANNNATAATPAVVPARPAANSPTRPLESRNNSNNNGNNNSSQEPPSPRTAAATTTGMMTPLSPAAAHPGSLSRGLVISFQQAMRNHHEHNPNNSHHNYGDVPPLHRREGHGNAVLHQQLGGEINNDPDATEFLSRILLLLGSFVILCLLLF